MNKSTPGPWKSGGCVVWQSNGGLICDLTTSGLPPNEIEANAELIAKAPEQQAIIDELVLAINHCMNVLNVDESSEVWEKLLVGVLNDAVSKATTNTGA